MNTLDELMTDPEFRRAYEEELLIGTAADILESLVIDVQISRSELAKRLGVTQGRVSQILAGRENLTLKSVAAAAWALGVRFTLEASPMEARAGSPAVHDKLPGWLKRPTPTLDTSLRTRKRPSTPQSWTKTLKPWQVKGNKVAA